MNEKKEIIFRCGKDLFERKGYKDTSVAEIMKQSGMATGTFYNYYTSKDALFAEIYNQENAKLKRVIIASLNMEDSPFAVIQDVILKNYRGMMENPILREWYNKDVFQKIEQSFRQENGLLHVDFLYDKFIEVVRKWQAEGKMRSDISAEMIMAMFTALVNVDIHKEEIGLDYFPVVLEYLMEFTVKGLTSHEDRKA
ncbi:MAG: TetR/AcrR family transcriptional regulator [Lachnospiraceae bacterium]|nr:TetR/AcrR family transcriptional regulator [Lachnospiraceae bacterium]